MTTRQVFNIVTGKMIAAGVGTLVIMGMLWTGAPGAQASHPEIRKVADRDRDAITLAIRAKDFADKRVRIRVTVVDLQTGKKMNDYFTKKLDDEGDTKVKIRKLDAGTRYKFYYRVKKVNDNDYQAKSDSESVSTRT